MANEVKISELPAVVTPLTTDYLAVVQDGVTKRETAAQLIQHVNPTITTSSNYTVLVTDYFIGINCASAQATQLPAATGSGRIIIIKDTSGAAATNNITITPVSGTIDGSANFVININRMSCAFIDGSAGNWSII